MLFNSSIFLFVFWPVTLLVTWALSKWSKVAAAQGFLVIASLFFYGWWNPSYVLLLAGSIVVNYGLGCLMLASRGGTRTAWLALGIVLNLGLLAYYKYWGFLCTNFGSGPPMETIVLPLAISFFTFTQITYLADIRSGKIEINGFLDYVLFVAFFPHLIAGPIVHHRQLIPQFREPDALRPTLASIVPGLALFILGLSKKMLVADLFAPYADQVFQQAASGSGVPMLQAWYGIAAYALQIYFDFSAYSDMALGIAMTFHLRFPVNFFSPYKAASVIDFWRRWHMTLSQFLRDYLYIPMGGSRHGLPRMLTALMITMLIGGLWHGANWTFVFWGGLHGLFLIVNHLWLRWRKKTGRAPLPRPLGMAITFVCVLVTWVFFRAGSFSEAWTLLGSMIGLGGGGSPFPIKFWTVVLMVAGLTMVFRGPNTMQIMRHTRPAIDPIEDDGTPPRLTWALAPRWAYLCGALFAACVIRLNQPSPFIYFQF
jgi:D-alanyl-lipoteichoic acid acyltransferase DltB (MBOAT superfamily)